MTAFDATEPTLEKARARCARPGLVGKGKPGSVRRTRRVTAATSAASPTARASPCRIVGLWSSDALMGDYWIDLSIRDAGVVRGIGALPMFHRPAGTAAAARSLALTRASEGR